MECERGVPNGCLELEDRRREEEEEQSALRPEFGTVKVLSPLLTCARPLRRDSSIMITDHLKAPPELAPIHLMATSTVR